jgi:hypothetical protein
VRLRTLVLLGLALTTVSYAQTSAPPTDRTTTSSTNSSARLPVTRVILYKNGVGYFEHFGRIRGNQDVDIDFTTAQLDDVLKSLTVLDLGKGRITGISYNSTASLERRLGSLHLPVGENPSTVQFLDALRGARLEVRSGSANVSGRLLSIDQRELPVKGDQKITVNQLSIVTNNGEIRMFDLNPATSVRIAEKDVNEQVGKYLGMIASTRDQDVRRMAISTAGDGDRELLVSYISEVPVWKCTYRIVIPKEGKPLLQGWGIVDNTVGEDWKNVELSLVAGAPQSFVQELSQPYYTRRPVVPLPENAMVTPQTHEPTMEELQVVNGELRSSTIIPNSVGGVPGGIPGGQAGGVIGGILSGSGAGIGSGLGAGHGGGTGGGVFRVGGGGRDHFEATAVAQSLETTTTVAQTQELGNLFEYKLKDRVTIRKNQSAMVPILQARIDAEKVSVWNPSQPSVLRALWIDNSSDLTLDGGSFNVLETDTFAGEGLMDPIKPGEKRLLSYAADLGLLVDEKQKSERQKITKVVIAHGAMTQMTEEREERIYTIRNRDTSARIVVIEHPARQGWKLADETEPAETTASFHRFRVTADPKKTTIVSVKEYRPISTRYELTNVSEDEIAFFVSQKAINVEVEKVLRRVVEQKSNIAGFDANIAAREAQVSGIAEDQERVRENMKALKGSAEEKALLERYARELNDQEDRVQSLQHETSDLQQKRDAAQKALTKMIEGLEMEAIL